MKENERCVNRQGQPSKLNKKVAAEIIENVRSQLSISNAARLSGLPPSTVTNWVKRGYEDAENGLKNDFTDFALKLGIAKGEKIQEFMNKIASGGESWKALAWLLERCCPDDFGKDSELYKQLLNDYKILTQSLIDQNKGMTQGAITSNTLNQSPAH